MTIYLKKKIIETFTINEKKIEKLGLGTLKNCVIYRRSDTHKIWTIVIWNGFVIIRLLQQRGGGWWWTPVFSSKFDECTLLILVRPPEWTQGPWIRVQSISSGTNSCLPMVTTCAIGPICSLKLVMLVCVTNNRIFTSV